MLFRAKFSLEFKAMLQESIFLATFARNNDEYKTIQVAEGVSHVGNLFRNLQRAQ